MDKVTLFDTTLRDGTQGEGISLSVDDKLKITERLAAFGIDYIEGGWPGSNPKDVEFFERVRHLDLGEAKITAFGSTRRANMAVEDDPNIRAILKSGVKTAAIFGKTWDFHVISALKTTLEENLAMIFDSVEYLKSQGLEVIFDAEHFFDGFKRNPEYAIKVLQAAERAGADYLVLCDTNGGLLPTEIDGILDVVLRETETPLGIHAHNDCGVAVANTLMAVKRGIRHVHGTMNGYGERTGNADLCAIIPSLQLKMGLNCVPEKSLASLTELSRFVSEIANLKPDSRQPFVGASAFAHKGGIHVNALLKNPETYEHMRPELVGNRSRVLISELAGISNIIYKAAEYDIELKKDSPETRKIVETIKDLEHQGYHFEGADGSFELLIKKSLGLYEQLFELVSFRLIVEKREENGDPISEATIKIKVGERVILTAAEGEGPVNALDNALRKALEKVYPELTNIKLSDYKVRIIDGNKGTAAKTRVLIESRDDRARWDTVGVSTNIIEASWRALVDSIEYGLLKAGVKRR